jgi:hypothetical protein
MIGLRLFKQLSKASPKKNISDASFLTICAYTALLMVSWCIYDFVAGRRWTSILTLSAVAHCFGLIFLCVQMHQQHSAAGISARALVMDFIAVSLRLSSTLLFHGYLPNDRSGDYAYQCVDLCSLALIVYLLRSVLVTMRSSYQDREDDMCVAPLVVVSLLLGAFLHGDMDDNPLFDSCWLAGLFVSVMTVLPQYWMISKSDGQMHALTAHYIAATAMDRILSGAFMWYVRQYITCVPWVGSFEHTICAILVAHAFHFVLLSDFAFYYVRALFAQGSRAPILPMGGVCEI